MFSALLLSSLAFADAPPPPPIVGGDTTADFDAVGALVAVDGAGNIAGSFCSGTLIDDDVVLTAAHCIDGLFQIQEMGFRDFEFVIGTDVFTTSGVWERLPFADWDQHPQWDPAGYENDVALVHLTRPSEVGIPALLNRGIADGDWAGQDITYVGWGKADDSDTDTSGIKRTVDVPFYDLYDLLFLTHTDDNQNVCYGDSGGAAFLTDSEGVMRLAGVNSFIFSVEGNAPTCQGSDSAAGAARVDAYLSWIETYVDLEEVEEEVEAEVEETEEILPEEEETEPVETETESEQPTPDFATRSEAVTRTSSGCSVAAASPHMGLTLLALIGLARRRD